MLNILRWFESRKEQGIDPPSILSEIDEKLMKLQPVLSFIKFK